MRITGGRDVTIRRVRLGASVAGLVIDRARDLRAENLSSPTASPASRSATPTAPICQATIVRSNSIGINILRAAMRSSSTT